MPVTAGTYNYWLAREELGAEGIAWQRPQGTVGAVALYPPRNPGDRWVFAALNPGAPDPAGGIFLGDDLEGPMQNVADVRAALDMPGFDATSNIGILWEILTVHADPDGLVAARPLMPTRAGELEVHLGGHSRVAVERYDPARHTRVLDNLRRDFALIRRTVNGRKARQVLGGIEGKYGRFGLRAADVSPDIEPLRPETTLTDTFTDADGTALDAHTSDDGDGWTEIHDGGNNFSFDIQTNQLELTGSNASARSGARLEADLSGEDQKASLDILSITQPSAGANNIGPAVRFINTALADMSDADADLYALVHERDNNNAQQWMLRALVGGSLSNLATASRTLSAGDTYTVEADGSTIRGYINDSEVASETDTQVTGHLRVGMFGFMAGTSADTMVVDSLSAEDLSAAETATPPAAVANAVSPTPTVAGSGAATLTPSAATADAVAPTVTIDCDHCITPTVAVVNAVAPTPTASATGAVTVTPGAAVAHAIVPSATASAAGAQSVTPGAAIANAIAPTVTASGGVPPGSSPQPNPGAEHISAARARRELSQQATFAPDDADAHDAVFDGRGKGKAVVVVHNDGDTQLDVEVYGARAAGVAVGDAGAVLVTSFNAAAGADEKAAIAPQFPFLIVRAQYASQPGSGAESVVYAHFSPGRDDG